MPNRLPSYSVLLTLCACATSQTTTTARPAGGLLFGMTAYAGSQPGEADASALEAALSRGAQRPVSVVIFSDESSLANALVRGGVDAAWMPPLAFVEARSRGEVAPLVKVTRRGLGYYRSVIFARADDRISSLAGLQGKTMAWVDHRSAAGYLFPLAMLPRAKLKPAELFGKEEFVGDHAAVCRAVLEGRADAGATFADDRKDGSAPQIDGCVQALGGEAASKLAILAISKPIPNDVVAIRPGCPTGTASIVKTTLLGLADDATGKAVLGSVFKADGFMDASVEDFGFATGAAD
jgi:phosphate/phosphite/phosphonate ABC transporter binding protein